MDNNENNNVVEEKPIENSNENTNVVEEKPVEPKKNNNILIIIIVLVLLVGVGVGCFFLGQSTSNKESSNGENKEENTENKNNETTSNTENTEKNTENKNNEKTSNTENTEKNEEPKIEPTTQDESYELSKCLNCSNYDSDTTIKIIADNGSELVKVNVKDDNKTVEIKISSEAFSHYGTNIKDRTITKQLNKEIKQVLVSSYGGDTGLLTIHYLMKDGTVEYTKVYDEIHKDNFDNLSDDSIFNAKEFSDIKDIIKLVPVLYLTDLGGVGVIAVQSNGYFYSLNI